MSFDNDKTIQGLFDSTVIGLLKQNNCSSIILKTVWSYAKKSRNIDFYKELKRYFIKKELLSYIYEKKKSSSLLLDTLEKSSIITKTHIEKMTNYTLNSYSSIKLIKIMIIDKSYRRFIFNETKFIKYGQYVRIRHYLEQNH